MNSRTMFAPMTTHTETHTQSNTDTDTDREELSKVHLHVCSVQSASRNLHSKFEKTFSSDTDAYELVNSYDTISVQQLGIEVFPKPSFVTTATTSFFSYLDICFAYLVEEAHDFSNTKKMVFFGHPVRVAVTREACGREVIIRLNLYALYCIAAPFILHLL